MAVQRKCSSQLHPSRSQLLIFWNHAETEIPSRPDDPERYPEDDERRWFDLEYAGWHAVKRSQPQPLGDGPANKRIICLLPAENVYQKCYAEGARQAADAAGVTLTVEVAGRDGRRQGGQVSAAIQSRPDLVILNPGNADEEVSWFRKLNEVRIPVIASNFLPLPESFSWFLAWAGPDDWGQSRMLARTFASLLKGRGGYAIFRHAPGSSSYYARTFGVLTELKKTAPCMSCLSMVETRMDELTAHEATARLLRQEGSRLRGIVAADDCDILRGINRAVAEAKREDVVRVAFGATSVGLRLLQDGRLHALAWQSPAMDGALAVRTAIDWFNGLQVQPLRYLPKYIMRREDAASFLDPRPCFPAVDIDRLDRAIESCDETGIRRFFEDVYVAFIDARIVREEEFRGFCIEALSRLLALSRSYGLREQDIFGSYEDLYKELCMQKSLERTLDWMAQKATDIVGAVASAAQRQTLIQRVIESVERNLSGQVSLKILSDRFGISRIYLGQLFKRETGTSFTRYLNARRVELAKKLLRTTSLKASEVSTKVGYSSADYFYKVFKKYEGTYPSQYSKPYRQSAVR